MAGGLIWTSVLALAAYLIGSSFYRWVNNVLVSRPSGLPVIIMPFHPMNIFFLITQGLYQPLVERLPFGLSEWKYLHFLFQDWPIRTKNRLFGAYGDVLLMASPGGRVVYVGDAEVATQLVTRRHDFPKDVSFYKYVRFYGDSVLATEGETWRRHRKVTAPPFSESVHAAVWKEAVVQMGNLMSSWASVKTTTTPSATATATATATASTTTTVPGLKIIPDTEALMRNVISKAGFGVTLPFVSSNVLQQDAAKYTSITTAYDPEFSPTDIPPEHTLSYGDAFDWILDHILMVSMLPRALLQRGPQSWKKTANAYDDVGKYLQKLVHRERADQQQSLSRPPTGEKDNLLNVLIRSCDSELDPKKRLAEADVVGNLFVFAVAGLETTAGTLQYAILQLAVHQEEQDWLHEDIVHSLQGESRDSKDWDYASVYPKMVGVMCVIHEVLRLHPTFLALTKCTPDDKPQAISYRGQQHLIPAGTTIFLCLVALHYNPTYWGPAVNSFQPQNWDARSDNSNVFSGWGSNNGQETQPGSAPFCHLRQPVKGAYLPFSDGFRSCLGKGFALVELTVFITMLFREFRVVVATRDGETQEMAVARARETIDRGTKQRLTLSLREEVGVRLMKR